MFIKPKNQNAQAGFTLIELSAVMAIFGLVIAGGAAAYNQWIKQQAADETRFNVSYAIHALTTYRDLYGHYPCPASLTVSLDNSTIATAPTPVVYGVATNCKATTADFALDIGLTKAGIARTTSTGVTAPFNYYNRDTKTTVPQRPIIRIGMLPYRTLNLTEDQAYDGYRNRLFYAVTEQLTDRAIFDALGGGISVLNEQDTSVIDPPHSAHFIIFSAGENEIGAFSTGGVVIDPCSEGKENEKVQALERQNCNFETDTVFRAAQKSTADGGRGGIDDVVAYASHKEVALWEKGRDVNNPNDISAKVSGRLGIGQAASLNPQKDLQVEGTLNIQPDHAATESNLFTRMMCEFAPTSTMCYSSNLIAGNLAAQTGGMKCPDSTPYMTGIRFGQPICTDEISITCPEGTNLVGITNEGDLDCQYPPCPETTVSICPDTVGGGRSEKLEITPSGAPPIIITFGDWIDRREETYTCEEGMWQQTATGYCEPCEATDDRVTTQRCSNGQTGCGGSYGSGNVTFTSEWICPDRRWGDPIEDRSDCSCTEGHFDRTVNCPEGFNVGEITMRSRFVCSEGAGSCTPEEEFANTCACQVESRACGIPCPYGTQYNGGYEIPGTQSFTCRPGVPPQPGNWGECVPDNASAQCECVPYPPEPGTRPCDGATPCGSIPTLTTYECGPDNQQIATTMDTGPGNCTGNPAPFNQNVFCPAPNSGIVAGASTCSYYNCYQYSCGALVMNNPSTCPAQTCRLVAGGGGAVGNGAGLPAPGDECACNSGNVACAVPGPNETTILTTCSCGE
jgi:prepilin-type N-terminal cleavage/methylation domain-containing protein